MQQLQANFPCQSIIVKVPDTDWPIHFRGHLFIISCKLNSPLPPLMFPNFMPINYCKYLSMPPKEAFLLSFQKSFNELPQLAFNSDLIKSKEATLNDNIPLFIAEGNT